VLVLVICVLVLAFTVFCIVCTVFFVSHCLYIYMFLLLSSVLPPSDNSIAVNNTNNIYGTKYTPALNTKR
jgi:hypothetical protein